MVNFVPLSANVIVMKKLRFAVQPERMLTVAQSSQLVNQKEKTCTTKSVQVSVWKHANTTRFHVNNLMTQIMDALTQITVKLSKSTTLENSVTSNNANLSVITLNTFAKETSLMMDVKKTISVYQNNPMISLQMVCAQELAQVNAQTGKSSVTEPLITMVIFTRDAKDKMFATPKPKIPMEYTAQENPILMVAHLKKSYALPKKVPLDVKKQQPAKTEPLTTKENIAQIPQTVPQFVLQIMSTAQVVLMKMDVRNPIFA